MGFYQRLASVFVLALALSPWAIQASANDGEIVSALDDVSEFDLNSFDWEPRLESKFYYALTTLNSALIANVESELVGNFLGSGVFLAQRDKLVSASDAVNQRATSNFSSGELLDFEIAVLFEKFVEVRLSMPHRFLGGCLANKALRLNTLSAMGANDALMFQALLATAQSQRLLLGADGMARAALISNRSIDTALVERQRLRGNIIGFGISQGGVDAIDLDWYEREYVDPSSARQFTRDEISSIISSFDPALRTSINRAARFFQGMSRFDQLPAQRARDDLCEM